MVGRAACGGGGGGGGGAFDDVIARHFDLQLERITKLVRGWIEECDGPTLPAAGPGAGAGGAAAAAASKPKSKSAAALAKHVSRAQDAEHRSKRAAEKAAMTRDLAELRRLVLEDRAAAGRG